MKGVKKIDDGKSISQRLVKMEAETKSSVLKGDLIHQNDHELMKKTDSQQHYCHLVQRRCDEYHSIAKVNSPSGGSLNIFNPSRASMTYLKTVFLSAAALICDSQLSFYYQSAI